MNIIVKNNLSLNNWLQIIFTTTVLVLVFYPLWGAKSFFLMVPVLLVFETGVRILNRKRVVCTICGFDPVLYSRDQGKARALCEKTLLGLGSMRERKKGEIREQNNKAHLLEKVNDPSKPGGLNIEM